MHATFQIENHWLEVLTLAAQTKDRVAEANHEIEKSGAYFTDRFGQRKPSPAIKVAHDHSSLFSKLMNRLPLNRGLHWG